MLGVTGFKLDRLVILKPSQTIPADLASFESPNLRVNALNSKLEAEFCEVDCLGQFCFCYENSSIPSVSPKKLRALLAYPDQIDKCDERGNYESPDHVILMHPFEAPKA